MRISPRAKEYLTVGRTLEELRQYEPQLRAAGFRKRYGCSGQSPNTGEFFQWWDRNKPTSAAVKWSMKHQRALRAERRCIICGKPAVTSKRSKDGYSPYCQHHQIVQREYQRRYREAHR